MDHLKSIHGPQVRMAGLQETHRIVLFGMVCMALRNKLRQG